LSKRDHPRRLRWFDAGAAALDNVLGDRSPGPHIYLCPLCTVAYDRDSIEDGSLTDEDVPPKSVGGQPLVLTCKLCNSRHGHSIDAHQTRLLEAQRLGKRIPGVTFPLNLTGPDGFINRGEASWTDEGHLQHRGIEAMNDWRDREGTMKRFREVMEGGDIGFSSPWSISIRRAKLSIYRSAYLAAFAQYGYALILRESFEPLRRALDNPDDEQYSVPIAEVPDSKVDGRLVFELLVPSEFAGCIGVFVSGHVAIIPWITQPPDFYEAHHRGLAGGSATFTATLGQPLGWPSEPLHLLDAAITDDNRRQWAAPEPDEPG
jgi:hypothetical protein